ncbi:hypothetical protein [Emticicia sp. BO119]|uniref:hypothetical protein n=1 Tax=Emticicia sp. BO119 TaxID=2757768 RepID=UPI0015F1199E|nr:hypothetical protein [Emticicia sp. BO119]MBA4850331.1 hypothetical protein [Emticicia sp. BO119]
MDYHIPSTRKEFEHIVNGFRTKALPSKEWTHEAHLITGLWHVAELGYENALAEMRLNIPVYNESVGGMNTDSSGYHDTITFFWIWLLNEFWNRNEVKGQSFERVCNKFLQSKYADRGNAFIFYTKDLLFTKEARLGVVEPDIQPLDFEMI